jgi:hypothetical protein
MQNLVRQLTLGSKVAKCRPEPVKDGSRKNQDDDCESLESDIQDGRPYFVSFVPTFRKTVALTTYFLPPLVTVIFPVVPGEIPMIPLTT